MLIQKGWTKLGVVKPGPVLRCGKAYKRPWTHQKRALSATEGHRFVFFNQPTGSGKSQQIMRWALDVMRRDPKAKIVIAVPQKIIAKGMLLDGLHLTGDLSKWAGTPFFDWFVLPVHNLLPNKITRKTAKLKEFLDSKPLKDYPQSRVLVCTHNVIRDFATEYPDYEWQDTALCFDEAHHLMGQEGDGEFLTNGCGAVAVKFLEGRNNLRLCIATATYGRHDKFTCLPQSLDKKLVRFELPFDEYLLMMDHLSSFSYEACFYKHGPYSAIAALLQPKGENAICYLAKRNTSHATASKSNEVKSLIDAIAKRLKAKISRMGPLTTLRFRGGTFTILDMVTEATQPEAEAFLETVKDRNDLQLIIALEKCAEGFDWPDARKSFIIGERHSMPQMIQIFGRLFRDVEGKNTVKIYQMLCAPDALVGSEKYREYRSQYLNSIMAAMLLMDVYMPAPVGNRKKSSDLLRKQVGSINERIGLEHAVLGKLADIESRHEAVDADSTEVYDEFKKSMPSLLKSFGVSSNAAKITDQFWTKYKRMGLNGKDIPLDKLKRGRALAGLMSYVAEEIGVKDFKELRAVVAYRRSDDEIVLEIKQLADDNGGKLPHEAWLVRNGLSRISQRIRNNPALLDGIEWEKMTATDDEIVVQIKALSAENGGKLPNHKWLVDNGYSRIVQRVRKNPSLLGRIEWDSKRKTDDEVSSEVKRLAKENNGKLPNSAWLVSNGYAWLGSRIRNNPALLGEIEWDRKWATDKEITSTVKMLAKRNGGCLPYRKWLETNGYSWLARRLIENPKLLGGAKWLRRTYATDAEIIAEIKRLAKDNGGKLPGPQWLNKNGYVRITSRLRTNPGLLGSVQWERRFSSDAEIMSEIKKLASSNGGRLPGSRWLQLNGHSRIDQRLRKNPSLLGKIKQERGRAA